jgi:hypothetical protein
MKSIHYAADEFLTGNDIADALVRLAEALAQQETSLAVDIPVRFASGEIVPVSFLLGPASQMVAVPSLDEQDEVIDQELVDWMTNQTTMAGRSEARPLDEPIVLRPSDDYEF